jgi:membrane protein implicated in regulation of membrane protease activity
MYAALWRVLPGPWWVRVLLLLVLLFAVLFVLASWVFPWVDGLVNPTDVTVNQSAEAGPA